MGWEHIPLRLFYFKVKSLFSYSTLCLKVRSQPIEVSQMIWFLSSATSNSNFSLKKSVFWTDIHCAQRMKWWWTPGSSLLWFWVKWSSSESSIRKTMPLHAYHAVFYSSQACSFTISWLWSIYRTPPRLGPFFYGGACGGAGRGRLSRLSGSHYTAHRTPSDPVSWGMLLHLHAFGGDGRDAETGLFCSVAFLLHLGV